MRKIFIAIMTTGITLLFFSGSSFGTEITIPEWTQNITLTGDIRIRYQHQDTDKDGDARARARARARVRARLGLSSEVNDSWKIGMGMATGGDDGRSTNQTLENEFESPDIRLDYAFGEFMPNDKFTLLAGKFKNPVWGTKDLLWDGDINPNGIAAKIEIGPIFITPAFLIVDEESKNPSDPFMTVIQAGGSFDLGDSASFKAALSSYNFGNMDSGVTDPDNGVLFLNDEDARKATAIDAQIDISGPVYICPFIQYVVSGADDDNTGRLVGIKFGDKKVSKAGQWQVKLNQRVLEKNAWATFLSDSDFYDGDVGVKGTEVEFIVGLSKNTFFGIDYYQTENDDGNAVIKEKLVQLDLLLKW